MSDKNEVVIVSALRTAIGSMGGTLKNIPGHELGSCVISQIINKSGIKKRRCRRNYNGSSLNSCYRSKPS